MKKIDIVKNLSLAATLMVFFSVACFAQDMSSVMDEEEDEEYGEVAQEPAAEEPAANQDAAPVKEAGAYQRSSVTFLNVPGYKDRNLSNPSWANYLVKSIQDTVRMARFDYNVISQRVVNKFVDMPNSMSIEDRMNATIVPVILRAVDAQKEIRAQAMLSQQQKNSFITDKAKELGITENELNAVMNSAYIFIPVYAGHSEGKNDKGEFVIQLTAGGYWWKIDADGQQPTARIIATIERTRTGVDADKNKAFQSAVELVAMDVQVATRSIPAFQLTAQIIEKSPRYVDISVGKNEGVVIDDKYRVFETREDGAGNVSEKRRGWVMVNKIKTDTEESKSQAQIISGIPYVGATVREIPHLPFDAAYMFIYAPGYSIKDGGGIDKGIIVSDSFTVKNVFGPRLRVGGNMANMLKANDFPVPQLWLNISGEYLFGDAKGTMRTKYGDEVFKGLNIFGGDISIMKKWYIRRFVVAPEVGIGYRRVILRTDYGNSLYYTTPSYQKSRVEWGIKQDIGGALANINIELAITPIANIGVYGGFNASFPEIFGSKGNEWKFTYRYVDSDNTEESKWQTWEDPTTDLNTGKYSFNVMSPTFGVYFNMAIPSGSRKEKANDSAQ